MGKFGSLAMCLFGFLLCLAVPLVPAEAKHYLGVAGILMMIGALVDVFCARQQRLNKISDGRR